MNDFIGKEQGLGVSNPFSQTTHDRGKIYFKTIQISRALLSTE